MEVKIPFYHVLNMFLTGLIFVAGLMMVYPDSAVTLLQSDIVANIDTVPEIIVTVCVFAAAYEIGLIINRIGAVIVEPVLKAINAIPFDDDYVKYNEKKKEYSIMNTLSREFALSRTGMALFGMLLSLAVYEKKKLLIGLFLIVVIVYFLSFRKYAHKIVILMNGSELGRHKKQKHLLKMGRVLSFLDWLETVTMKLALGYIAFAVTIVSIPMIVAYSQLQENIRTVSSALIGGVMSLIVIPILLDVRKRAIENREKNFEKNYDRYVALTKVAVGICLEDEDRNEKCNRHKAELERIVSENYDEMSIHFPSEIYWAVHGISFCLGKGNMSEAQYYARRYLALVRKHAGLAGTKCHSKSLLEILKKQVEEDDARS